MQQAVFICGFNNWGKTTIINSLFRRQRYLQHWHYNIIDVNANFTVESHSNDDLWGQRWIDLLQFRIDNETTPDLHLFSALCPTIHLNNDFVKLLSNPIFASYQRIHIFLIEFKFDHHARLMIQNILEYGANIPNINFIVIDADSNEQNLQNRLPLQLNQIVRELQVIFP